MFIVVLGVLFGASVNSTGAEGSLVPAERQESTGAGCRLQEPPTVWRCFSRADGCQLSIAAFERSALRHCGRAAECQPP